MPHSSCELLFMDTQDIFRLSVERNSGSYAILSSEQIEQLTSSQREVHERMLRTCQDIVLELAKTDADILEAGKEFCDALGEGVFDPADEGEPLQEELDLEKSVFATGMFVKILGSFEERAARSQSRKESGRRSRKGRKRMQSGILDDLAAFVDDLVEECIEQRLSECFARLSGVEALAARAEESIEHIFGSLVDFEIRVKSIEKDVPAIRGVIDETRGRVKDLEDHDSDPILESKFTAQLLPIPTLSLNSSVNWDSALMKVDKRLGVSSRLIALAKKWFSFGKDKQGENAEDEAQDMPAEDVAPIVEELANDHRVDVLAELDAHCAVEVEEHTVVRKLRS